VSRILPDHIWHRRLLLTVTRVLGEKAVLELASTDVVEIRSDARCGVVVWAGVAIGPVG